VGDRKHRGAAGRLGRDQAAAIDVALRDHAIERSDDLLIALLLIVIIQLLLHRREIALSSSRPMPPSLRHTNRCRFALAAPIHRWQGWRYACWSNLSRRAEPRPFVPSGGGVESQSGVRSDGRGGDPLRSSANRYGTINNVVRVANSRPPAMGRQRRILFLTGPPIAIGVMPTIIGSRQAALV
jgi:hypothetical protein